MEQELGLTESAPDRDALPRGPRPHGVPGEPGAASQRRRPHTGALQLLLAEGPLQTDDRKVSYSLPLLGPPSLGSYIYYGNY